MESQEERSYQFSRADQFLSPSLLLIRKAGCQFSYHHPSSPFHIQLSMSASHHIQTFHALSCRHQQPFLSITCLFCGASAWASASCGGASCISASCPGATWLEAVSWSRWAGASWQDEKVFNTKGFRSGGGAAPWPEAVSRFGSCAASWGSGAASWPEAVSSCMAASIDDAAPTVGKLWK